MTLGDSEEMIALGREVKRIFYFYKKIPPLVLFYLFFGPLPMTAIPSRADISKSHILIANKTKLVVGKLPLLSSK